jgi:hypothetical protein
MRRCADRPLCFRSGQPLKRALTLLGITVFREILPYRTSRVQDRWHRLCLAAISLRGYMDALKGQRGVGVIGKSLFQAVEIATVRRAG